MRSAGVLAALTVAAFATPSPAAPRTPDAVSPVDRVNTYIGTGGGGSDYGGTMPFVTTPFGTTNWSAQTRQNSISVSSYAFEDNTISGFIGTHQPAIWMSDYGYVTLIPEVAAAAYALYSAPAGIVLPFDQSNKTGAMATAWSSSCRAACGWNRSIGSIQTR
jgi:putative alpha-1,2-mannosidase